MTNGPTREEDLAELTATIHIIQRTVMAQAAARAYPGEFRLLGEVIPSERGRSQHVRLNGTREAGSL